MSNEPGFEPGTITSLLAQAEGDFAARRILFERVYPDLRRLAKRILGGRRRLSDLEATGLLHSACERLMRRNSLDAENRRHFFFLFGRMMKEVLIEEVRKSSAKKRGGGRRRVEFEDYFCKKGILDVDVLELQQALTELRTVDSDAAEFLNLHYFCGQSIEQAASTMNCSFAAARGHGAYGLAWLRSRLSRSNSD